MSAAGHAPRAKHRFQQATQRQARILLRLHVPLVFERHRLPPPVRCNFQICKFAPAMRTDQYASFSTGCRLRSNFSVVGQLPCPRCNFFVAGSASAPVLFLSTSLCSRTNILYTEQGSPPWLSEMLNGSQDVALLPCPPSHFTRLDVYMLAHILDFDPEQSLPFF